MIYNVVNDSFGTVVQVMADSVHCTGHAENGTFTAQFNRQIPNPEYRPNIPTFGMDADPDQMDDPMDDGAWRRAQRQITSVIAIYSGCREVTLVE